NARIPSAVYALALHDALPSCRRVGQCGQTGRGRVKLIIGNRNYSSWSLRGWLAAKQSGLSFEALTVHIDGDDWQAVKRQDDQFQDRKSTRLNSSHVKNSYAVV